MMKSHALVAARDAKPGYSVVQSRLVQIRSVASGRVAEGSVSKVARCAIVQSRPCAVLNLRELSYLQTPSGMTLRPGD
ncbi:hypothetical protein IG631_22778 [Alternaria alternata]|nr:hypothetical protein IG631_22778 [Alternaria alternata]